MRSSRRSEYFSGSYDRLRCAAADGAEMQVVPCGALVRQNFDGADGIGSRYSVTNSLCPDIPSYMAGISVSCWGASSTGNELNLSESSVISSRRLGSIVFWKALAPLRMR